MSQDNRPDKPGINDPDFIVQRAAPARRCPNCRSSIEGRTEMCPHCNHYLGEGKSPEYVPISNKTARKIRWISGGVILGVFLILVIAGVIKLWQDKYYINNEVTVSNIVCKVTDVRNTQSIGSDPIQSTEYNFIIVYINVKNEADSAITLSSSSFNVYKGSAKYESKGMYSNSVFLQTEAIGSGVTKSLILVFESASASTADTYELEINYNQKKQRIILKQES